MFLLDLVRGRWGIEETIAQIRLISERWPMANVKLVENKAAGPEIVRRLRNEISGFRDWPVEGDKETRMRAQEHHFVGGHVWLPSPGTAAWMRAFRAELCQFPKGFSDQVDSCSQALDYLGRRIKSNAKPLTEQRKSVFLLRKN